MFYNPLASGTISYDFSLKEKSYAERRRDNLIWKIKTRKANINKIILSFIVLIFSALIISVSLFLSFNFRSIINSILLGFVSGNLIMLVYFYFSSVYECDASLIKIKHRNKIY